MILTIPYRSTEDNGRELRFAIRSMVMHFKDLTGVCLIGNKPTWYTGQHIPYPDTDGRKEHSIYSKLMQAQGTVLYSNDDFFALQPFNHTLPNYYRGLCKEQRPVDKRYKDLYQACPGDWLDFDVHTPMIIDTTRFQWLAADMPIKSVYGNMNNLTGTLLNDQKFKFDAGRSEIKNIIKGRPFFSTHDPHINDAMIRILNELYPDASDYEK